MDQSPYQSVSPLLYLASLEAQKVLVLWWKRKR